MRSIILSTTLLLILGATAMAQPVTTGTVIQVYKVPG